MANKGKKVNHGSIVKNQVIQIPARKPRLLIWDLECSNLNANFGFILCSAWRAVGDKTVDYSCISDYPLHKKDPTNDYHVVKATAEALSTADAIITWYGSRFDFPYLQSRLLFHKLPLLPQIPHIDGWKTAKYRMKLNSNRLQSVTSFLGLEDKTPLSGPIWIKAQAGHKESIKYVLEHNIQDVVVLEQVYEKIRPLIAGHPNVNLVTETQNACPTCGSTKLRKAGTHISMTSKKQRYQCGDCGSWSVGPNQKVEGVVIR